MQRPSVRIAKFDSELPEHFLRFKFSKINIHEKFPFYIKKHGTTSYRLTFKCKMKYCTFHKLLK